MILRAQSTVSVEWVKARQAIFGGGLGLRHVMLLIIENPSNSSATPIEKYYALYH